MRLTKLVRGAQDVQSGEQRKGKLWVTRKGATSARKGQKGIIPGAPSHS